jgi:hypothetical protein
MWVWDPSAHAQGNFQLNYGFRVGGALALYKTTARDSAQNSVGSGKTPETHELVEIKLDWSWLRVKPRESQTLWQSRHCLLEVRWLGPSFPCPDMPSDDWQRTKEILDPLKPLAWAKLPAIGAITWRVRATKNSRTWSQERRIDHFPRNAPLESRNLNSTQGLEWKDNLFINQSHENMGKPHEISYTLRLKNLDQREFITNKWSILVLIARPPNTLMKSIQQLHPDSHAG